MKFSREQAEGLLDRFGSPLYVVDGVRFADTFRRLEAAMQAVYPSYRIAYSVKTNYLPFFCGVVKECAGMAEVVSGMEYDLVRRMGFSPSDIVFNGPYKGDALEKSLTEGACVIVDNAVEARAVADIARKHAGRALRVGLRLNYDVGNGKVSRFGFDVSSDELRGTVSLLSSLPNVLVEGIHCHFTGARSLDRWELRARTMIDMATRLFDAPPRFIDLGSGMYGEMAPSFARQFGDALPTFEDYARAVATPFACAYEHLPVEDRPLLITEPGTTLVANAVDCLSTVMATKKVRDRRFAVLDASSHILGELSEKKNLPLQILRPASSAGENMASEAQSGSEDEFETDLVGYTCLEYDVIYRGCRESLREGDIVAFGNVGSYSMDMKPPFISPSCAAVAYTQDGSLALVKRRENLEDVFATYAFPA